MKSINKMHKEIERQRRLKKIVWLIKNRHTTIVYLDRKEAEKFCFKNNISLSCISLFTISKYHLFEMKKNGYLIINSLKYKYIKI